MMVNERYLGEERFSCFCYTLIHRCRSRTKHQLQRCHVVKAYNDNDLVEVTTQACGINGFGNTTVKLTRQQHQSLEQYLVEFRARLNKTTTREEVVPIFKGCYCGVGQVWVVAEGDEC